MQVTTLRSMVSVNWRIILRWGSQGFVSVLIVAACFANTVKADPGDLDTSFGNGGLVLTDFGGRAFARAIAIQSDGKIVAAGRSFFQDFRNQDFALARYNTDGRLDTSFGNGGLVLTDFGGGDEANAIAIQSDGKIVAAGRIFFEDLNTGDFALARYNTDGRLDNSFGNGGLVFTDFGESFEGARAIAIQSDGKIVATGIFLIDDSSSEDFPLARYNTDGSLDNSFGNGGLVLTDFNGFGDRASAIAIQSDGKIVAAGFSAFTFPPSGSTHDFALARYNTDGSLDNSFGNGGLVLTDFNGFGDRAFAIAIQSDGKIVAAGSSVFAFALVRYLNSSPSTNGGECSGSECEQGDANGDGLINILDVTAILNDILVISPAPGNGDCNEDGQVNILDVTCVLNTILGG